MFINNLDPVLFQLGTLQIRFYGLIYSLSFLMAYLVFKLAAKKKLLDNFDDEKAEILTLYLIGGIIIGARVFEFIFFEPRALLSNPLELFLIWHGGLSFHGGVIGGVLAGYLFSKKYKVKFYKLADLVFIIAALSLFLGRIANFVNGELVGTKTNVPWCTIFPGYDGLPADQVVANPQSFASYCRHPSQLYEAGKNLLIFFILLGMYTKKKFKDGVVFWTFILLYGILRFIINFWREDARYFGLSTGQYLSLFMIPVALYFLYKINTKSTIQNRKK